MIQSKEDLNRFLRVEKRRMRITNPLLQRLSSSELFYTYKYFKNLRYLEYYTNKDRNFIDNLVYFYHVFKHRRNKLRTSIYISPNTVGEGFLFIHLGFVRLGEYVRIGKNCTMLPMVLIGKRSPEVIEDRIIIGDNCYISTGVTILGPLTIGDNVVIAAGAVVVKDVPDNCVVAGVPAKIVKQN